MILSIVIPAYNVEKYIERCLLSILGQDVAATDYEIIVVNDGSRDQTESVTRRLSSGRSNIKVVTQQNQGLSVARNNGLALSRGKYIWFIDSDDWIPDNCMGQIVKVLNNCHPDALMMCAADFVDGELKRRVSYKTELICDGRSWLQQFQTPCAPFHVWSRTFLDDHKLRFIEGVVHEDSEFTPRAAYFAKNVVAINDICYVVYHNPNSITRTFSMKRPLDLIRCVNQSLSEFSERLDGEELKVFHRLISTHINTAMHCVRGATKEQQREVDEAIYEHRGQLRHLLHSGVMKYWVEGMLFRMFPRHYVRIYKLMQLLNR